MYVSSSRSFYLYLIFESVCSAASETESPRTNIAKAVRRVFYRIIVFYVRASFLRHDPRLFTKISVQILGILITGMLVPYNDSDLLNGTKFPVSSNFGCSLAAPLRCRRRHRDSVALRYRHDPFRHQG